MSIEHNARPRVIQGGSHLRSIGERNGFHCLSEKPKIGESISGLTKRERHEYFTLLTTLGVPKDDAKEAAKRIKSPSIETSEADVSGHQISSGTSEEPRVVKSDVVKTVLSSFRSLINGQVEPMYKRTEAVPVGQEITVYSRE